MFLGSVIYDKRRSLNLTQGSLADGLCNQNTISKMEKHNMTPQIDVLIKICHRLDLSLNDVFSDFSSDSKQEQLFVLDSIEEDVLLNKLTETEDKLSLIKSNINNKDMAQYDFIVGVLEFQKNDFEKSSFNLDKVLQETKSDNDNIYTLMAYLFKSLIYLQQKHLDMASYYLKNISESLIENLNIANASGVEILFLCKSLGNSYLTINENDAAIKIAERGITFANSKHLSYFLDELAYLLALGTKNTDDSRSTKYKNIALACSQLFDNKKLQNKIAQKLN